MIDHNGFERLDWGLMDYLESLEAMRERHAQRVAGEEPDAIICVEHPAVFTLGKRGGREHILLTDEQLADQGFKVYSVERGGDVTYHGPGQAVVYPVVDLRARKLGVKALVGAVADCIVEVVASYGVVSHWDDERPGVWTSEGCKIAAVGLALPQKVSMHGLALNVCTNIEHYHYIEACGLDAKSTSLTREAGREITVAEAHDRLFEALSNALQKATGSLAGESSD